MTIQCCNYNLNDLDSDEERSAESREEAGSDDSDECLIRTPRKGVTSRNIGHPGHPFALI